MSHSNTYSSKRDIAIAGVLESERYGIDAGQRLFDLFYATSRNEAEARFLVGCVYASGNEAPVNLAKAFKWIAKAANQGHAKACAKTRQRLGAPTSRWQTARSAAPNQPPRWRRSQSLPRHCSPQCRVTSL